MYSFKHTRDLHSYLFFLLLDKDAWIFRTSFSKFSGTNVPFSSKNRATDLTNDDSRQLLSFLFFATSTSWYWSLYLETIVNYKNDKNVEIIIIFSISSLLNIDTNDKEMLKQGAV